MSKKPKTTPAPSWTPAAAPASVAKAPPPDPVPPPPKHPEKVAKPKLAAFYALALIKTSEGWVSAKVTIDGDKVTKLERTEPDLKVITAEKFRINVAAMLTGDGVKP